MKAYALVLVLGLVHGPGVRILDTEERFETLAECRVAAKAYNTGPGVHPRREGRCENIREFDTE